MTTKAKSDTKGTKESKKDAAPDVLEGLDDLLGDERIDSPEIAKDAGVENVDKDTGDGQGNNVDDTNTDDIHMYNFKLIYI